MILVDFHRMEGMAYMVANIDCAYEHLAFVNFAFELVSIVVHDSYVACILLHLRNQFVCVTIVDLIQIDYQNLDANKVLSTDEIMLVVVVVVVDIVVVVVVVVDIVVVDIATIDDDISYQQMDYYHQSKMPYKKIQMQLDCI